MSMTFQEATGQQYDGPDDQDGCDYIRDDGSFAIQCLGHYTVAELETKLRQLRWANLFYEKES